MRNNNNNNLGVCLCLCEDCFCNGPLAFVGCADVMMAWADVGGEWRRTRLAMPRNGSGVRSTIHNVPVAPESPGEIRGDPGNLGAGG